MKKQQIQISENKRKKAFTLVELIIVITILAILATIAFVSFSNYTKSARDANRVSTLTNLQKGLDIYSVQVGRLPVPENPVIFTGGLNGNSLINQGILTQEILQTLSSTPVDPVTGKEYTYSTFGNGKYYQIAGNLETELSQNLGNQTYANTFQTAKLIGNYRYDPSLPSLIIGSGSNIFSPDTCFIVDGGSNTLENCTTKKSDLPGNTSDSSLVGYWDMESLCNDTNCGETTNSGKLKDLSGNGNYGVSSTGLTLNNTGGYLGRATFFNGQTIINTGGEKQFIKIEDAEVLKNFNSELTISTISYANENNDGGRFLFHRYTGSGGLNSIGNNVGYIYGNYATTSGFGGPYVNANSPTENGHVRTPVMFESPFNYGGKYFLLTSTYDGNKAKIYVNGILAGERTYSEKRNILSTSGVNFIGAWCKNENCSFGSSPRETFHGIIDEVKIYNRALTDEEILQQAKIAGF